MPTGRERQNGCGKSAICNLIDRSAETLCVIWSDLSEICSRVFNRFSVHLEPLDEGTPVLAVVKNDEA